MGMTAVFTAPPQFTVLSGRQEIGLTEKTEGPPVTATRWPELARDLDRLEEATLLRGARRRRRQSPLADTGLATIERRSHQRRRMMPTTARDGEQRRGLGPELHRAGGMNQRRQTLCEYMSGAPRGWSHQKPNPLL
jgi:hypothetical protein